MSNRQHKHEACRQRLLAASKKLRALRQVHQRSDPHPRTDCMICGVLDCPAAEPLHYHPDGCPVCDTEEA